MIDEKEGAGNFINTTHNCDNLKKGLTKRRVYNYRRCRW